MNPRYHYVPVSEPTGAVNAIQVYVDHDKRRGGIVLGMMGVKRKAANEEWEGSFPSVSFVMFDPIHKSEYALVEPAARLNRKRVGHWDSLLANSIATRVASPGFWPKIEAFAATMKFAIALPLQASA